VRYSYVTADADHGDNPNFPDGPEQRRQRYVVAIRADFTVAARRAGVTDRVEVLSAVQPSQSWRSIKVREGSEAEDARLVCRYPLLAEDYGGPTPTRLADG
jgi:hypothetical protein